MYVKQVFYKNNEKMKASESMSGIKPKKSFGTAKTVKSKKVTVGKLSPSDEEISKKAYEIYHQRIGRGESGTAQDDWQNATDLLLNS